MNYGSINMTSTNRFFNDKIEQLQKYLDQKYIDIYDDHEINGTRHFQRIYLDTDELEKYDANLQKLYILQAELLVQMRRQNENIYKKWCKKSNDSGFVDNEETEISRSVEWPEFDPFIINDAQWHNGDPIVQHPKTESEQNIETHLNLANNLQPWRSAQKIEADERITANITYLNIPHMKTRNITNNIFHSITTEFPTTLIFALSEIYARPHMKHLYDPPGYTILFHKGGSIKTSAIMYKNVDFMKLKQLNLCGIITTAEVLFKDKTKPLITISAFYRSPSKNQTELLKDYGYEGDYKNYSFTFLEFLTEFVTGNGSHCAFGDINWNLHRLHQPKNRYLEKEATEKYGDILNFDLWNQRVTFPTRNGGSKIDIALVPRTILFDKFKIWRHIYSDLSDHFIANLSIPTGIKIKTTKDIIITRKLHKFKNKSKFDADNILNPGTSKLTEEYTAFCEYADEIWNEDLTEITLKNICQITPNDCSIIYDKLKDLGKTAYPKTQIRIRNSNFVGKFNNEIWIQEKLCVKKYKEAAVLQGRPISCPIYKQEKSKLRMLKKKFTREFWMDKITQRVQDKKLSWSLVQQFRQYDQSIPVSIMPDQFALTFLNLMYDYTPLPDIKRSKLSEFISMPNDHKFDFQLPIVPKTADKMTSLISYTNDGKGSQFSMAWDQLSKDLIKILPSQYYNLLATLLTKLLENGVYLEEFRETRCIPIYKRNIKTDPKNYRPIHIISSVGNLLEKIFARQMMNYVENKNILKWCQYGFRAGRESGMLLNEFRRYFLSANLNKVICAALVTDMTNAFGSTDCDQIIEDLAPIFSLRVLKTLRSFLSQSKIQVEVNNEKSGIYYSSPRGSGQGSSLSAQIYVVLMRSSHVIADNFIQLSFADDATAITMANSENEIIKNLQDALQAFINFCKKYNMKINVKKTFIYLFGRKCNKKMIKIFIGNEKLEITNDMNLLGIRLNDNLLFTNHFKSILSYFQYKIALIGQFGKLCDHDITRMLIHSYLIGKINYGSAYIPLQSEQVYSMLQNKVNLLIQHKVSTKSERSKFYNEHVRIKQHDLLGRINCKSFKNVHRFNQMSRLGKLTETAYPAREFGQFLECLEIRGTRRQIETSTIPFFVQKPKKYNAKNKRFFTCAPMMWATEFSKLPISIRNTIGTDLFKSNIKKFYNNRCQHQEYQLKQCTGCLDSTKNYGTPQNLGQLHQTWFTEQKRSNNFLKLTEYEKWVDLLEHNEDMNFDTYVTLEKDLFFSTFRKATRLTKYLKSKNWHTNVNEQPEIPPKSATYESDYLDESDNEIYLENLFTSTQ